MNNLTESVVTVLVAIIGLATLAVIVSRNARTTEIIDSTWGGFSGALGMAISPVTGGGNGGFNNTTGRVFG